MKQMEEKKRHGCLTAWLSFMIIANALVALMYLFGGEAIRSRLPNDVPFYVMLLLAVVGLLNIIFAVMILQWKKWGFWGFILTGFVTFIINLSIGLSIGQCLFGLIGVGILFGVLQIKRDGVSAWDNMS